MNNSKKIILVSPRGFCAGVTRAIDVVLETLKKYGSPSICKSRNCSQQARYR